MLMSEEDPTDSFNCIELIKFKCRCSHVTEACRATPFKTVLLTHCGYLWTQIFPFLTCPSLPSRITYNNKGGKCTDPTGMIQKLKAKLLCDSVAASHGFVGGRSLLWLSWHTDLHTHTHTHTHTQAGACVCVCVCVFRGVVVVEWG